jgi:hypothetical protein
MKGHVESFHNNKRTVAIMTNVDESEKENLSLAVKREQVESALDGMPIAAKPSMLANPCRGILSPVQPQADVIYVRRNPTPPTASSSSSPPVASSSSNVDLTPSVINVRSENPTSAPVASFDVDLSPLVASTAATAVAVAVAVSIPPLSPPKQTPAPTPPSPLQAGEDSSSKGDKCNGCGKRYTTSKAYHDRLWHQYETTIKTSGGKITISRNAESREFTCPLCNRYVQKDPAPFGVCVFLSPCIRKQT